MGFWGGGTDTTTLADLSTARAEERPLGGSCSSDNYTPLETCLSAKPLGPVIRMTPSRPRSASTASYLRSIADGDLTAPQVITRNLTNALTANDYSDYIRDLPSIKIKPQAYIDGLDKVCPRSFLSPDVPHSQFLGVPGH